MVNVFLWKLTTLLRLQQKCISSEPPIALIRDAPLQLLGKRHRGLFSKSESKQRYRELETK
jgi:hypothetical protein